MKNLKLKPGNLLYNILVAFAILCIGFACDPIVAVFAAITAGVVLGFAPMAKSATLFMAIQKEIWEKDIQEEIFKNNAFLRKSFDADEYVLQGKVVHIPQSGGSGSVVKNRTSLPANVRKRTDTDIAYALDAYTTDPVLIPNAENYELSYDKRQSVLGEDKDKLNQTIAEEVLYSWVNSPLNSTALPAGLIFKTTGAAAPATAPGATGNRKKAALADLQLQQTYYMTINRWFDGKMNALLTPQMMAALFPADSVVTATYMAAVTEEERRKGVMYKVQGWNIMSRSSVLVVAANFTTIKAPGQASAVGDNAASLFWYEQAVELALGGVDAFEQLKAPQFYGDIYSFEVRMGSRARRADYSGISLLVEDTAA